MNPRNIDRRRFLKRLGPGLLGGAMALSMGRYAAAETGHDRLNFIFFLIDDFGWTDLACYGSPFYETPHMDRLAGEGMKFTDAYSACTVCSPTRAAILTGKYPARLGVTDWIPGHNRPFAQLRIPAIHNQLAHEETTIAEVLKSKEYACAHVGKWHLGGDPFFPDTQGFDINVGGNSLGHPPSYFSPYKMPILKEGPEGEYLTDRLGDEAVRFIEENRNRPFFLYFAHYAVHNPLQAKKELIEYYQRKADPHARHNNPIYAAMIHSVDETVGRILDTLDQLGLADRTVIFFTGDNGGLLPNTSNAPLRAGKGSAYEGGVRVPLLVRWPGVTPPGSVCAEPVTSVDYFPTIAQMAAIPVPNESVDGVSLVPLLQDPRATLGREAIYWHYPHYHPGGATPYGAVRKGDYKLIEFFEDGKLELYNLKEDVGESNDLSQQLPEAASALKQDLAAWRAQVNAQMPWPNPDYDPTRAGLRMR